MEYEVGHFSSANTSNYYTSAYVCSIYCLYTRIDISHCEKIRDTPRFLDYYILHTVTIVRLQTCQTYWPRAHTIVPVHMI
jgi:hypothetical protein